MNLCWLIHPNSLINKSRRTPDSALSELKSLASAINLKIYEANIINISNIKPGTFFGKGKIEEINQAEKLFGTPKSKYLKKILPVKFP